MSNILRRHIEVDPITDDDAAIAVALEDVSVPALVASVVQLTGDPSIIRGTIRPHEFIFNEFQGALTDDEKAKLRGEALQAIIAYRDAGCVAGALPEADVIREVMDWIACEHVPDDYAAMFLEEMDLGGEDPRRLFVPNEVDRDLSVIVVGCGQSGLLAGMRLKQAGIPFEIIEKNADVGGTWLENTYPGLRVDVGNHYYCYSFEPNHGFTQFFSRQQELLGYFRDVMDRHGIAEHVRWQTEVERMEWDDNRSCWNVTVRRADGAVETTEANAVISAVGQLNRPYVPDFPGLDRFRGNVFHSARWDHSIDLRGKRVAMIGCGASGLQIAPAIADAVEALAIFQRSPQWITPNAKYHEWLTHGDAWAMRHVPSYSRWIRFMWLWQANDKVLDVVRVDPDWPDFPWSANADSAERREQLIRWMEQQVGDDPELLAKVVPNYPPMGKRMLQDNGSWLRCLKRPNVELVTDHIVGFEEDAVLTKQGRFEVDLIILATGFRANEFLSPMEIVGRQGRTIDETWDGRPAAYLGISVPDFPNLFLMYGPGTNLAHAGSIIFQSECQMQYIGGCLRSLLETGARSIEPSQKAHEDYFDRWQAELATTVWSHPSVNSWYKAADGKVYILSPWRIVDYWKMTAKPAPEDHVLFHS